MLASDISTEDVFADLQTRFGDCYTREVFVHEVALYQERVICRFISPALVRDAQVAALARIHENQEN